MALNIPMPDSPGTGFLKGIDTGSAMFSRLMQPIIQRENMQRQWKEHLDQLALQKQAQERASQRLPFQIQAFKDAHSKAMYDRDPEAQFAMMQKMMGLAGGMGGEQNPTQGQQMPGQQMPQEQPAFPMMQGQGMPGMQQLPAEAPQLGEPQKGMGAPALEGASGLNPLQLAIMKKFTGLDLTKETPSQKRQGAINQAISVDEVKANRKKIDEIEKTAQALLPYLGKVNTIEDILQRKPELAGRTTQLADLLGMTKDEDAGTFLSAAQALQAHMAKEMSSRGGYGVSKLVEQAKPNLGKSTAYNKGVIKELKQGMRESFDQMNAEYKRLTGGKSLPFDFEQYFKAQTGRLKFNPATGRLE